MKTGFRRFFAAAPHRPLLPDEQVKRLYPHYRFRVLQATFLGYAAYYLVRNNLAVVSKDMQNALHFSDAAIGNILAISAISYGVGKFVMGALSDRSNARVFMATGLLLTAVCNFLFGGASDYSLHLLLWCLNGFFQGMGWPPCGRCMGHWFSQRERGLSFSIWNTSHNLGGGIAGAVAGWAVTHFHGWQYAFYLPGFLALAGAFYLYFFLVDTPQSVGLPPIERYKNDYLGAEPDEDAERELTYRELLIRNVLLNKWVWILALANLFVYISRYSMLDWGPKYLREVKGATAQQGGWAILYSEFGGIPSTILLGWVSDRLGGRRGAICALSMIPIMLAFGVIMLTPPGYLWLDYAMLALIGLFVYPIINLITIMALDLTSKKAIGTAAGFIGLLGYVGRTVQAKGAGSLLEHYKKTLGVAQAWNVVFWAILGCSAVAFVLLLATWNHGVRRPATKELAVSDSGSTNAT